MCPFVCYYAFQKCVDNPLHPAELSPMDQRGNHRPLESCEGLSNVGSQIVSKYLEDGVTVDQLLPLAFTLPTSADYKKGGGRGKRSKIAANEWLHFSQRLLALFHIVVAFL